MENSILKKTIWLKISHVKIFFFANKEYTLYSLHYFQYLSLAFKNVGLWISHIDPNGILCSVSLISC